MRCASRIMWQSHAQSADFCCNTAEHGNLQTLQEVSHGRLLLGIGAGGGRDTPYADDARQSCRRNTVRQQHETRTSTAWLDRTLPVATAHLW